MAQRSSSGRGATTTKDRSGSQISKASGVRESDIAQLRVDEIRGELKKRGISGISSQRKGELVKTLAKTLRAEQKRTAPTAKKPAQKTTPAQKVTKAQAGTGAAAGGGGARRGTASARSLKYAQYISSPDEQPSRPGRSLVTTDHEVIRRWAQDRNAQPATIEGTERTGRAGVLRFDFPGFGGGGRLRPITWDEWFDTFDERGLNFIYQQQNTSGRQSNFFRLESPEREDA